MATQQFVSPGVFTREVDLSFLAAGVAGIGAATLGRTLKGPAYLPTRLGGFDQFNDKFGNFDPNYPQPYAQFNYLKNSNASVAVRVLGHADGTTVVNGYSYGSTVGIIDSGSVGGSFVGAQVLAVLHTAVAATGVLVTPVAGDPNRFTVVIRGASSIVFQTTASFLTGAADWVGKTLNDDPTQWGTYQHYLYAVYPYATPLTSSAWNRVEINNIGSSNTFQRDFSHGTSTNIKSQLIGSQEFDLFKVHTQADGRPTNDEIKIEIANIKPSTNPQSTRFGTFDLRVRSFYDTDQRPIYLETFSALSLDPSSKSYIARRIGDAYEAFDTTQRKFVIQTGQYPLQSKYIRIEMITNQNPPAEALPWGFRGYSKVGYLSGTVVPSLPYVPDQFDRNGNVDQNTRWGVSFVSGGIVDRMRADPDNVTSILATDSDFSLSYLSSSFTNGIQVFRYNTSTPTYLLQQPSYPSASLFGFTMPMQGGFDGWDLRLTNPLHIGNATTEAGSSGYTAGEGGGHAVISLKRALDTVSNPDWIDINLLAVPGIHNVKVCDYARQLVNNRADAFYVMDITGSSVTEVVGNLANRSLDDNYTACYYPRLKFNDTVNNQFVTVYPSVAVLGAIAFNDRVGQPWFAPAGLNRGGLGQFGIVDVLDRLTFQDRNTLYDSRINPIATFPQEGICIFGQKTLQVAASALDRVNVRRLLIFAKKTIASAAKYLLFEQNNPTTWKKFSNQVNPILQRVQQNQGLNAFKVVMDTTTNTPDVIDRNVMVGKVFLQPTKAAEYIDLSFIITSAGVQFGA